MHINLSLILPAAAVLAFAGCDQQTKLTVEQVAEQTRKLTVLQENQARQVAQLQAQLTELGPRFDKMNSAYFEKSYTDAFFFHTNTLYLILAVDRQIESALKAVENKQQAEQNRTYVYHTNLLALMQDSRAETIAAVLEQQAKLETNVVKESRQIASGLMRQIQTLAPDADELAWRKQLAADLRQIKSELALVKAALAPAGPPAKVP
jgi:hypothetical protein